MSGNKQVATRSEGNAGGEIINPGKNRRLKSPQEG